MFIIPVPLIKQTKFNSIYRKKPEIYPANNRKRSDETASEVSSIDSDENFRSFQKKNRELQTSMLITESIPFDFPRRLHLLERAAFHRPLSHIHNEEHRENRFLSCNCSGFESNGYPHSYHEELRRAVETAKQLLLMEIKANKRNSSDGGNDSSEAQKSYSVDDSSECRELLRVQYNLNYLYKQELEIMCKTCKTKSDQLTNEINQMKYKIEDYEDKIRELESITTADYIQRNRMIQVGSKQGSFEIHFEQFKPTKEVN